MDTSRPRRNGRSSLRPVGVAVGVVVALGAGAVAYAALRPPAPAPAPLAPVAVTAVTPAQLAPVAEAISRRVQQAAAKPVTATAPSASHAATSGSSPRAGERIATAVAPGPPKAFDAARAMTHVRVLADRIGVRTGGTSGEQRAIDYARDYLKSLGYDVTVQAFKLDNGRTSHNVVARRRGASGPVVVLGGHIDTKAPAPGADDNASGVGTVLELARDFARTRTKADIRFVAFGCEELIGDGNSNHHHYGSRAYVRSLSPADRAKLAAAISIDMIGVGTDFRVRTMGVGTRAVADRLLAQAKRSGAPLAYLRDPGSSGWSDHEAFEVAGYPAAWLEWRDDARAHTSRDTVGYIDSAKIRTTGTLVRAWLLSLTDADLATLVRTRG